MKYMEKVLEVETLYSTWCGRRGESKSFYLTPRVYDILFFMYEGTGLRINVMKWLDENKVEISLQSGDGRTLGFKCYKKVTLEQPTEEEIEKGIQSIFEYAIKQQLVTY